MWIRARAHIPKTNMMMNDDRDDGAHRYEWAITVQLCYFIPFSQAN